MNKYNYKRKMPRPERWLMLYEIRIHGRGGQGAVSAGRLLGEAASGAGFYVQSFPEFGAERSGAPVTAYARLADEPIETRSPVNRPDFILIIDPYLAVNAKSVMGLKEEGMVISNSDLSPENVRNYLGVKTAQKVASVNATKIAVEAIGRNNPNTPILGAWAAVSRVIPVSLIIEAVKKSFPGNMGEANAEAVRRGAAEVIAN